MVITCIFLLISVFLEGIFLNIFKDITPFFVLAVILISSLNKDNNKKYYILLLITGIIYDLLYTNALFIHAYIFVLIGYLLNKKEIKSNNVFKLVGNYFFCLIIYTLLMILFTFTYTKYTLNIIFNILFNGIIINLVYLLIIYIIYKLIGNRFKKKSY